MDINLSQLKEVLVGQKDRNSIIANNLANLNTHGFKRDILFAETLAGELDKNIKLIQQTDFTQGQLKETNNPMDLALSGPGFFTLETENGLAYTRDGHFKTDAEGILRNSAGYPVLGTSGWISVLKDGFPPKSLEIAESGEIYVNGELYDRLLITDFESYENLKKAGENMFVADEKAVAFETDTAQIHQGFLEDSNVNPVKEMIELIELERQFESVQRMVRALDDTFRLAVNQVGQYR